MGILTCDRCANFMNWTREWGNLWRCGDCGKVHQVGHAPSSRQAVEGAIAAARGRGPYVSGGPRSSCPGSACS